MTTHSNYSASLLDFVNTDTTDIASSLPGERSIWLQTISLLKQQFQQLPHLAGDVILGLQHQQQALDTIVLYRGLIFVIAMDFKQQVYRSELVDSLLYQAQYLKQHHSGSQTKLIVPVHIVPNALPKAGDIFVSEQLIANTMCDTGEHLALLLEHFANQYKDDQIILTDWLASIETEA
ncbi:hypothetical protein FCU94_03720 [Vibrio sp. JPW-9-11-11]|uniref:hypothetical protein n=1 Tax=Vibrio sp. JPW-9-11-11 TaxID=1416532 RepID=UPI001593679C|nr:hypothetical protein [Vibrio sp. JPW-9-11-11]NVD06015.1 hypothetical protein [Vibrio sp. JPW-9-11-11]